MTAAGQIILEVIVRPVFAVWITLAVNYEKSILYFVLAFISCSLIALTCCCGQSLEPDISSNHIPGFHGGLYNPDYLDSGIWGWLEMGVLRGGCWHLIW